MLRQLHIFVNGHAFRADDGVSEFMTGSEIAALVGPPPAHARVLRDIKIDPKELHLETYPSSTSPGQSEAARYAGVRVTHIPTGLVVSSQSESSQIRNRFQATRELRNRLSELGYVKQRPIAMDEQVRIENGDSFLVTTLSQTD